MDRYMDIYLKFVDSSLSPDASREHAMWAAVNTLLTSLEAYDSNLAEKVLLKSLELKIKAHNLMKEMEMDYAPANQRVA